MAGYLPGLRAEGKSVLIPTASWDDTEAVGMGLMLPRADWRACFEQWSQECFVAFSWLSLV